LKENNFKILELSGCNPLYKRFGRLYNVSPFVLYAYLLLRSVRTSTRNFIKKGNPE